MSGTAHHLQVGAKGRIIIPAAIREQLGINVGDSVDLQVVDDELRISTMEARIKKAQRFFGKFSVPGKLASDELIEERREAAKHE